MVTQLKKEQSLVRNLFLTKVTQENILPYQEHINEVFSDPNKYFVTDYYSNKVIIGRNHSKKAKRNIITTQLAPCNSSTNSIRARRSSLVGKKPTNAFGMFRINQLPPNKYYISDNEVRHIYQRFKEIKERNASRKNGLDDKGYSSRERETSLCFMHQRNALEKYSKFKQENKVMSDIIAKKAKRNVKNLLMKNINVFRMKREQRDKSSDEISKRNQSNINDWILNLKNKQDLHYVNASSKDNPKWHIILHKKNQSEIIRDPKVDTSELKDDNNHNKLLKPVLTETNSFNKKELKSSLVNYQKTANSLLFQGLYIKGNDLLQTEYNSFKKMRQRKIITKNHKSDDSTEKEKVFVNNSNPFVKYFFD